MKLRDLFEDPGIVDSVLWAAASLAMLPMTASVYVNWRQGRSNKKQSAILKDTRAHAKKVVKHLVQTMEKDITPKLEEQLSKLTLDAEDREHIAQTIKNLHTLVKNYHEVYKVVHQAKARASTDGMNDKQVEGHATKREIRELDNIMIGIRVGLKGLKRDLDF